MEDFFSEILHAPPVGNADLLRKCIPFRKSNPFHSVRSWETWQPSNAKLKVSEDVEEMEERVRRYMKYCAEYDLRIINASCYLAIGINSATARNIGKGTTCKNNPEMKAFIRKENEVCNAYREMLAVDNNLNPVSMIWWQKNYDGFTDKKEISFAPASPLGELVSKEELESKIVDIVVEDVE